MWLHVISDGIITLSYYCIPFALIYLVRQRRDLPFNWIFWMFGLFILGCGTTHLMEVWTIWHANYLLSGIVKAITAAISVVTARLLIPLIPKAIALPGPEHLHIINRELQREISERMNASESGHGSRARADAGCQQSRSLSGTVRTSGSRRDGEGQIAVFGRERRNSGHRALRQPRPRWI